MNLLLISSDQNVFDEGSATRARVRAYAEAVAATGGTLHLLSRAPRAQEIAEGPLFLHGVRVHKLAAPWILARHAHALITAHAIDAVSAQDPFEHGWAALRALRGTPAKLHLQVHTDYLSPWFTRGRMRAALLNRVRVRIADRVVPQAQGIRVVSARVKGAMRSRYGATLPEPAVIPIPVSAEVPPPVPLPERFPFTLIAVCRLEPEKRVQDAVAAIARLQERYPMLGLVVAGDGRERSRLKRYARARGVGDRVRFLGWRADARGLMQSAQGFIQASAYEGYGLSLIEAALAGVPIITTDVGIVGEVFVNYDHALVAQPGDIGMLATHIARLIEDNHARVTLEMNGREAAQAHLANVRNTPADIIADIAQVLA